MIIDPEQRVGIYVLMNHWRERGTRNVEEMRLCRSLLARVDISADQIDQLSGDLQFDAGPIEAEITPDEQGLLAEAAEWREEALRANGRRIPSWLAAVDELVRPGQTAPAYEEPVSTYTNLAFGAAGVLLFALVPSVATGIVAGALAYLAYGSWQWHATKDSWAQARDEEAMYLAFGALAGLAWTGHVQAALALGIALGAGLALYRDRIDSFVAMPALVLGACAGLGLWKGLICLGVFAAAVGCRRLGEWLQARSELAHDALHGAFHVVAAGGAFLVGAFALGVLAL